MLVFLGSKSDGPKLYRTEIVVGGGGPDFLSGLIVIGFLADNIDIHVETYPDIP